MTSEIAILNKEAVALAADSALTLEGKRVKIYNSAYKIFALSRFHPIGVMIHGNAELMGIPWEIIIKLYRKKLQRKKFDRVDQYAKDFIRFLNTKMTLFPEEQQDKFARSLIHISFLFIKDEIEKEIYKLTEQKEDPVTDPEAMEISKKVIENYYQIWKAMKRIKQFTNEFIKEVKIKYEDIIEDEKKVEFRELLADTSISRKLSELAVFLLTKSPEGEMMPLFTGLVITGFGEKEVFPAINSYTIEGVVNNKLKYFEHKHSGISHESRSAIIPFAQKAMVYGFMEGVMENYQAEIENYFFQICNELPDIIIANIKGLSDKEKKQLLKEMPKTKRAIFDHYIKELEIFRAKKYVIPVIDAVAALPKDELANMAESLVYLTSFKKKVTMDVETVGGPIDVAIISKGDGFIWIKRKHYFKPELNPQFFEVHYKEGYDGKKEK